MATKNKRIYSAIILHIVVFFLVWSLCETWLKSHLPIAREEWFREIVLKTIIWTIPALLLIRAFSGQLAISLKEMISNRINWLSYVPIFALFTAYIIGSAIVFNGGLEISPRFAPLTVAIVLSVAIGEELVFRGWLLNATLRLLGDKSRWLAILVNAVIFLSIHFPLWIYTGTFLATLTDLGFVAVLALSVIFSFAFIKSRSIWPPVALHAYWNLLMLLFLY